MEKSEKFAQGQDWPYLLRHRFDLYKVQMTQVFKITFISTIYLFYGYHHTETVYLNGTEIMNFDKVLFLVRMYFCIFYGFFKIENITGLTKVQISSFLCFS